MRHLCDDRISLHLILLLSLAPTQLRVKGTGEATAICFDQELPGLPFLFYFIKLLRNGLRVLWMYLEAVGFLLDLFHSSAALQVLHECSHLCWHWQSTCEPANRNAACVRTRSE